VQVTPCDDIDRGGGVGGGGGRGGGERGWGGVGRVEGKRDNLSINMSVGILLTLALRIKEMKDEYSAL
jgi:hypothetical protein